MPDSSEEKEVSLADLLPDLVQPSQSVKPTPITPQLSPSSVYDQPVVKQTPKPEANPVLLFALAGVGLLVFPLVLVGLIALLGSKGKTELTPAELAALLTPVPTVVGITPHSDTKPTVPPPRADCPPAGSGALQGYPCAHTLNVNPTWVAFFEPAEQQIFKDGNGPVGDARYDVSDGTAAQIIAYYDDLLSKIKFKPVKSANGNTNLGNYKVALYNNGSQQIQIIALLLNKPAPQNMAGSGQTVIRLSASK